MGPGPVLVQYWTSWAVRIPTGNCRKSRWAWGGFTPDQCPAA